MSKKHKRERPPLKIVYAQVPDITGRVDAAIKLLNEKLVDEILASELRIEKK